MADDTKVRENRLRRMARRQGLTFTKARRIDSRALDYGLIRLMRDDQVLAESSDLDRVEDFLTGDKTTA